MTARIHIRPAAKHDLDALTDYFLTEVDADMAGRFVEHARKSFTALLQTPGLGPPVPKRTPLELSVCGNGESKASARY